VSSATRGGGPKDSRSMLHPQVAEVKGWLEDNVAEEEQLEFGEATAETGHSEVDLSIVVSTVVASGCLEVTLPTSEAAATTRRLRSLLLRIQLDLDSNPAF
jgi:hypothetical protein